jgi:hypothetical protein
MEQRAGVEPQTFASGLPARCHAVAGAIVGLQKRSVFTQVAATRLPAEWDAAPLMREAERAQRGAADAEAALAELERGLAKAEADLLVLAAGRAPDHEAALARGD